MSEPVEENTGTAGRAGRRWPRVLAWLGGAVLALLLLLPLGAWWWASRDGSLPRALQLAQRLLPPEQTLQFSDAQGSVAGGGRIGRLQWSKPGLALTIDGLELDWSLRQLIGRELQVRTLQAASVHVRQTPQPETPDEPFVMPADLSLPIAVTLPLAVSRLQVDSVDEQGAVSTQVIDDLRALYRFDRRQHMLRLDSLRYGRSSLQGEMRLHARELALDAQLVASLRDLVPAVPLAMQVRVAANGTLAGGEAAQVMVELDAAGAAPTAGTRLQAQATLHPWRAQPLQQLQLQASDLNAHAFHQAAPGTALRGQASVQPAAGAASEWDMTLDFSNDQPGAWPQQLPLRALVARARLTSEALDVSEARVELAGTRRAGSVSVVGQVPLARPAQATLRLGLQGLDLQPLMTRLPRTAFSGEVSVQPLPGQAPDDGLFLRAQADIRNAMAGPLDRERVPVDRLLADLRATPAQWHAETLQLQVGGGRLQLRGDFDPRAQALDVRAELQRLPLRRIHGKLSNEAASELSGSVVVDGDLQQGLAFDADIDSPAAGRSSTRAQWEIRAIEARGRWSPSRLAVERIHLDAFRAQVDGNDIEVALPAMDSIKARVTAAAPGLALEADAAMLQQSGGGRLALQLASAGEMAQWLRGLPLVGESLPRLQASGSANLQARWQGGWRQWADGFANPAAHPQLRMDVALDAEALHVELPAVVEGEAPSRLDVDRLNARLQGNLAAATLVADGDLRANGTRGVLAARLQMRQAADNARVPLWNVTVEQLSLAATMPKQQQSWRLQVSEGLQVSLQGGDAFGLRTTAGRATLAPPPDVADGDEALEVTWQPLEFRRAANGAQRLRSTGSIRGIQPGWVDALLAPQGEGPLAGAGMYTDLRLSGDWDIDMGERLDIRAHVKRDGGDVWLLEPVIGPDAGATPAVRARDGVAAGIRNFDLQVRSQGQDVALALDWNTERAGIITANVRTQLAQQAGGWRLPDPAPLSGNLRLQLQDLGAWGFLAPPGWRVRGTLDADVTLAGSVQAPRLQGGIEGKGLNIRSVLDGVDLHDGELRASFNGQRLEIAELTLQGGTGSRAYVRGLSGNRTQPPTERGRMTASGTIDWSGVDEGAQGSGIAMDVRASLQRMQVLVRNDRQLSVSGDLSTSLQQGALRVRGDLRVDRATILLPDASAPTLGDDVQVVRGGVRHDDAVAGTPAAARAEMKTAKPMDLEIKLDLGRDLALQGHGITTRLEGELTVRSATGGSDPFLVVGEVRTDEGRYRAWGQALNVETGVVRFNGPYANPSLNLLAIRPEIEVRAGVRVTGTLAAPRVQLYSDPEMPESEKLSWVVLGRATATTGAEGTSMQRAALGLLAGGVGSSLAGGLGLDEIGLAESGVSIGKRLSDEFYVTYEAGLSGAASTLYIFYDITRRFTVRGQTGEASAVDLIYTISYN